MKNLEIKKNTRRLFLVFLFFGITYVSAPVFSAPDALAIRIFKNTEHYSALTWYKNKNFTGSPQSIIVDGYEAVRDGRTVYVNAANIINASATPAPGGMATNIYLISYNQDAAQATVDIFGRMLDVWKFNVNVNNVGQCVKSDGTSGDNCHLDDDCPVDDYCNSNKAMIVRDVRRWGYLADIKIKLEDYKNSNLQRVYPQLGAGTYVPGISLSVWPSWKNTLSKELGMNLPVDPINRLDPCSAPYNEKTCWDEHGLRFVSPTNILNSRFDTDSRLLAYRAYNVGTTSAYEVCAMMETGYVSRIVGTLVGGIDVSGSCGINL